MKKRLTKIKKVCLAGLEPCSGHMLNGLMAAYTFVFYTLLSINSGLCRLVKVNFVLLKDTAGPVSINAQTADLSACQKCRWTGGFSALYSKKIVKKPNSLRGCDGVTPQKVPIGYFIWQSSPEVIATLFNF